MDTLVWGYSSNILLYLQSTSLITTFGGASKKVSLFVKCRYTRSLIICTVLQLDGTLLLAWTFCRYSRIVVISAVVISKVDCIYLFIFTDEMGPLVRAKQNKIGMGPQPRVDRGNTITPLVFTTASSASSKCTRFLKRLLVQSCTCTWHAGAAYMYALRAGDGVPEIFVSFPLLVFHFFAQPSCA